MRQTALIWRQFQIEEKNEPSFIDFTAVKLAEVMNVSKSELIKSTSDNFNKLFLIKIMKFIILGCGSSMGVPRPDGFFGNCDPKNKKNYRTRCSALIQTSDENILVDTSPDLRQQLLRHKIKKVDKVLYSHMHTDQTHGINDLRSFYINNKRPINVYADKFTSKYLKENFSYIFKGYSNEYPATLKLNKLEKIPIQKT